MRIAGFSGIGEQEEASSAAVLFDCRSNLQSHPRCHAAPTPRRPHVSLHPVAAHIYIVPQDPATATPCAGMVGLARSGGWAGGFIHSSELGRDKQVSICCLNTCLFCTSCMWLWQGNINPLERLDPFGGRMCVSKKKQKRAWLIEDI